MAIVSRGFRGRRQPGAGLIPPGQYLVDDFPVLTAGPTPDLATLRITFLSSLTLELLSSAEAPSLFADAYEAAGRLLGGGG